MTSIVLLIISFLSICCQSHDDDTCANRRLLQFNNPGCAQCSAGYEQDPGDCSSCIDIDECATNNGGCNAICVNTEGSFRCEPLTCGDSISQSDYNEFEILVFVEIPYDGNLTFDASKSSFIIDNIMATTLGLCCSCTKETPGVAGCAIDLECEKVSSTECNTIEWDDQCVTAAFAFCNSNRASSISYVSGANILSIDVSAGIYRFSLETYAAPGALAIDISCQSHPTNDPTRDPTNDPTIDPTTDPTNDPTIDPTIDPTNDPTRDPTIDPTAQPTIEPTQNPTAQPTLPTSDPTTSDPTNDPTENESANFSVKTSLSLCVFLVITPMFLYFVF